MTYTVADLVVLLREIRETPYDALGSDVVERLDAAIEQLDPSPKPVVRVPVTWIEDSRRLNKDGTVRWVYWKGSHGGGVYYSAQVPEYRSIGGEFSTFEEAREASERVIAETAALVAAPILCKCGHACGEDDE
jgi:hypothetical protein